MTETRRPGLFGRLRDRIASSTTGLRQQLTGLAAYGAIDDEFWDELEQTLMSADLGPEGGLRLAADIRAHAQRLRMRDPAERAAGLRTLLLNRVEWPRRGPAAPPPPTAYPGAC